MPSDIRIKFERVGGVDNVRRIYDGPIECKQIYVFTGMEAGDRYTLPARLMNIHDPMARTAYRVDYAHRDDFLVQWVYLVDYSDPTVWYFRVVGQD